MDEPRPLSDDDRDPLARLVRHGRGLEVAYDVEAGLARHTAAIAGGAQPWSTTSGSGWGLGLGLGVVAIAAVVAGWIAMRSPEATPVAAAIEVQGSPSSSNRMNVRRCSGASERSAACNRSMSPSSAARTSGLGASLAASSISSP